MAKPYLTVKQVADRLQVSVETVRGYINHPKHPLPASDLGRGYRISEEDLEKWMEERKIRPKDENE